MSRFSDSKYWSIGDVAEFLGVTTKTVKNMHTDGRLVPHHRAVGRGDRRYDPKVVKAYRDSLSPTEAES